MLNINNLWVTVDEKTILRGVNLEIDKGEVVAVMGPNGSGKSTLAYTIAGYPRYKVLPDKGSITFDGKNVKDDSPDERAGAGIFLAMQYPMAVPGLKSISFLWQIYKKRNGSGADAGEFQKWIKRQAELLGLKPDLLGRSLNDGFSGGEKKKMEILQMLVFNPKLVILDEIDSGLDVDALKRMAAVVAKVAKERKMAVLVITHYLRFLEYLVPDKVVIMNGGKIVDRGGVELIKKVDKKGYKNSKT